MQQARRAWFARSVHLTTFNRQWRTFCTVTCLRGSSSAPEEDQMGPVMLATDGSPIAAEATTAAIELARQLGAELLVVSVWDNPYVGYSAMGFAPAPISEE